MTVSTIAFWTALLTAVLLALAVNLACLIYLWRKVPPPSDRAVAEMLRRIAIFNALPLLWLASYFGVRIGLYETNAARGIGIVAYATIGYLLALTGLCLPSISAAVLSAKRARENQE